MVLIICVPPPLSHQSLEVVVFCILLYVYKWRKVTHVVIVLLLVALLGMNQREARLTKGQRLWI